MRRTAPRFIRVAGRSMLPFLPAGSVVALAPPPAHGSLFGRVALLPPSRFHPHFHLHRVIHDAGVFVVTRGDASAVDDPPLPRAALLAVAVDCLAGPAPALSRRAVRHPRLFGMIAFLLRPLAALAARLDGVAHRLRRGGGA